MGQITDVLTALVPSTTSSADHILPVLIYTLIISPPDINITSNLLYIQRFRYHKLVDGEDAYCLTNLEAAISFLETVDMGTLTATEAFTRLQLESDALTSRLPHDTTGHSSLRSPISTPAPTIASVNSAAQLSISSAQKDNTGASLVLGPVKRITYLTPVEFAASAATSAVNTADQSLKTIGNSLENSYKFLFGKLSDKRTELPKTLEDVRKLVGTPTQDRELSKGPIIEDQRALTRTKAGESSGSDTVAASVQDVEKDDGNRRKNITSGAPVDPIGSPQDTTDLQQSSSGLAYTPVADSVRNLGSHLGRFAGNINVIRSFSRTQMNKTPPPLEPDVPPNLKQHPHQDISKLQPPVQRFLETEASDLKIGDIDLLLRDYRRLVTALKNAGAF
ncbi:Vacuolar protein-sorting-associated protein [Drechslerella dactyloides]|uniref:Vacuolar protein-sorting-associated protein n=1 Tax=Drechslerella dactyloides TaxID=74499 RepID=A0AAD6IRB6_DREDA|nr:Vacuolar protein-sorting-associated protein [Drechslerella dactyloides]